MQPGKLPRSTQARSRFTALAVVQPVPLHIMRKMHTHVARVVLTGLMIVSAGAASARPPVELKTGEHVAVIGNALGDRMQHDGWLETLVHAKYPSHQLVWRNLAVAGDEVAFRHRSENFGTPHEWLTKVGADVVLAFFGFNESFKGEEGLAKFKADLAEFL